MFPPGHVDERVCRHLQLRDLPERVCMRVERLKVLVILIVVVVIGVNGRELGEGRLELRRGWIKCGFG